MRIKGFCIVCKNFHVLISNCAKIQDEHQQYAGEWAFPVLPVVLLLVTYLHHPL